MADQHPSEFDNEPTSRAKSRDKKSERQEEKETENEYEEKGQDKNKERTERKSNRGERRLLLKLSKDPAKSSSEEMESKSISNKSRKRMKDKREKDKSLATSELDEKLGEPATIKIALTEERETPSPSLKVDSGQKDSNEETAAMINNGPATVSERGSKRRPKSAVVSKVDCETETAQTSAQKPCPKVAGPVLNAGTLRVLGSGGIKGTSLPLLLNMPAGGGATGGLSLLPAGLPPGRYVILPSTTSSVPSVTSISATTIHSGTKFLTAPTMATHSNNSAILSTTASSVTPTLHLKGPPTSLAQVATAGRFNARSYNASMRGTLVGNRGPISAHGRRKSYTAAEKLAMIAAVESGQRKSMVADMFGVAPSTLACILLQKHKIRSDQDLTRRRLRQPKQSQQHLSSGINRTILSKDMLNSDEGDLPFGTHFLSPQSPYRMFDDSPEEIVTVPDFEDRLGSCEGSKGDGASGSYLTCASSIPSIVEDSGEPGLLKNAMGCGDDRSYYSEDDIIGVKSELSFPPDIEIDEENVVENTRSSSPVSRTASPTSSGMTGPYLLKKETHCSSILDELLKDDTFTDVTLSAEGQHIRAHRIILCLSSKYFKEVLSKESSAKNVIFFRDIKYDELKNLITFIYTGEVTVDAADLESFMKTAELLEVTSLCEGHKNFPKGFPLSKNSTGVSKPTTSSSKRTNSSLATHSPPSKTRKITSTTETPVQCKPRRKRSNAFSTPSTPVTVKSEPVTADSEDEDDLKEETVETSSTFIDVGHLSSEDEIGLASAARLAQGLTPEKLESTADATQVTNVTVTPGRCPFCSPTRQLYIGPIMLTHLQISHPDETAYPCDNCYSVFINKISFLAHHKECKR